MSRIRTAALFILCAGLAACDDTPDSSPTGPELAPAGAEPGSAALQWALTRLADGRGEATAINGKGQIVGYYDTRQGTRAFIWSNGTLQTLGTLGGHSSRAWAINEAGQVVGGSTTASGLARAFLWENGTMRDLGTLGAEASTATAIESDGRIVGYTSTAGLRQAFIWENGTMRRLAGLESGFSVAQDIDNAGRVVGRYGSESEPRAFRWAAGRVTDLGTLGGAGATATALGPDGRIVGWSMTRDGFQRGFLWQNGRMRGLGTLAGGNSAANGMSGLGHIVGWSQALEGEARVFLWRDGVRSDVGRGSASGVNRNAWIVGGLNVDGGNFPVVWRQTTEPPPPGRITVGTSFFLSDRNGSADLAVDTVAVGTEVTWTWISGPAVQHSVQSVGTTNFPSSGLLGGFGVTYKVRFTRPGSYRYNCSAHPGNMTGRVVVK